MPDRPLLLLIFQLVWATSWEHGANRLLAPRLGLPEDLPVIIWPDGAREGAPRRRQSWKTPYVAQWVGARPFVWIDDEVNRYDRAYLRSVDGLGRSDQPVGAVASGIGGHGGTAG